MFSNDNPPYLGSPEDLGPDGFPLTEKSGFAPPGRIAWRARGYLNEEERRGELGARWDIEMYTPEPGISARALYGLVQSVVTGSLGMLFQDMVSHGVPSEEALRVMAGLCSEAFEEAKKAAEFVRIFPGEGGFSDSPPFEEP